MIKKRWFCVKRYENVFGGSGVSSYMQTRADMGLLKRHVCNSMLQNFSDICRIKRILVSSPLFWQFLMWYIFNYIQIIRISVYCAKYVYSVGLNLWSHLQINISVKQFHCFSPALLLLDIILSISLNRVKLILWHKHHAIKTLICHGSKKWKFVKINENLVCLSQRTLHPTTKSGYERNLCITKGMVISPGE
jgi:hypothetical protein